MGTNTANRGNPRKKAVTIKLSEEELQKLAMYGKHYDLTPTAAARRLVIEGLTFHQ